MRLWLRVTIAAIRTTEAVSRRLTNPDRGRCPATGRKHRFIQHVGESYDRCGWCARPKMTY